MSPLYNKYTDAKKMDPEKVLLSTSTTETIPSFLKKEYYWCPYPISPYKIYYYKMHKLCFYSGCQKYVPVSGRIFATTIYAAIRLFGTYL